MNLYEYMEDFDNSELSEEEWQEQMKEAVEKYNEEYSTQHRPNMAIARYKKWKYDKYNET